MSSDRKGPRNEPEKTTAAGGIPSSSELETARAVALGPAYQFIDTPRLIQIVGDAREPTLRNGDLGRRRAGKSAPSQWPLRGGRHLGGAPTKSAIAVGPSPVSAVLRKQIFDNSGAPYKPQRGCVNCASQRDTSLLGNGASRSRTSSLSRAVRRLVKLSPACLLTQPGSLADLAWEKCPVPRRRAGGVSLRFTSQLHRES